MARQTAPVSAGVCGATPNVSRSSLEAVVQQRPLRVEHDGHARLARHEADCLVNVVRDAGRHAAAQDNHLRLREAAVEQLEKFAERLRRKRAALLVALRHDARRAVEDFEVDAQRARRGDEVVRNVAALHRLLEQAAVFLTGDARAYGADAEAAQHNADVDALAARVAAGGEDAVGRAGREALHVGGVVDAGIECDSQYHDGSFLPVGRGVRFMGQVFH